MKKGLATALDETDPLIKGVLLEDNECECQPHRPAQSAPHHNHGVSPVQSVTARFKERYQRKLVLGEGDPKAWSAVLVTALGSWGKHSVGDPKQWYTLLVSALGSWGKPVPRGHVTTAGTSPEETTFFSLRLLLFRVLLCQTYDPLSTSFL